MPVAGLVTGDNVSDEDNITAFRLKAVEESIANLSRKVDSGFEKMDGKINTLQFVGKDAFESWRQNMEAQVASARALSMWALGVTLTAVAVLSSLVGILKFVGA